MTPAIVRPTLAARFFGIRTRLILLVLVAVLPLLALVAIVAKRQVVHERGDELVQVHAAARAVAVRLDDLLANADTMLALLAQTFDPAPGQPAKNDTPLAGLIAGLPDYFENVSVYDVAGRLLGSARKTADDDVSERRFHREALTRPGFVVGDPTESGGRWTLTLARQATDAGGRVVGVVGIALDLVPLGRLLDSELLPKESQVSLIDPQRHVITRSVRPEATMGSVRPPEAMLDRALAARDGSNEFINTNAAGGERRLAGYSTCTRAPWLVYARVPTTVAFAEAERQYRRALTIAGITIVVTLGLAWYVASRITRPMRTLAAEAATLGAGGKLRPLQFVSRGEVGVLANAFNQMLATVDQRDAALRSLNETLHHRVAELQTLFDLMPVGIGIAVDATGRDIRMNRTLAGLLGLSSTSNASLTAPARDVPTAYHVRRNGRELQPEELPIQRAMAENASIADFEHTVVRADGSEVGVLLNAVPLRDADGRVCGCVATFQDLTARQEAERHRLEFERKLQETQKLESLGVLAGGIAHDFNNILTGILGNASLAALELPPGSAVHENLGNIREGSVRAADLCKQMLAYSGKGRFVIQKLDLNRLIEETTHLLGISISKKAVLRFNLSPSLPSIEADGTQIRQVIMNLVINASEAIGERSGTISLNTGVTRVDRSYLGGTLLAPELPEGNYVSLEVSDSGCGMSQETQSKIFEPFFTTKFTGRGLGLAAVLGIVRGHRGAIKIYSEPGRGTTFKLLFPCVEGAAAASHGSTAGKPIWRGTGRVLVVDDEESVRATAAMMLCKLGFEAELAADGREALAAYRAAPDRYALVLMDLTMPHLDGEQTFTELRRLRPTVRVLLMSGFNEQEAVARFTGKGLASFLQKPFQIEELSEALQRALGKISA